jgi:hypothetical protein
MAEGSIYLARGLQLDPDYIGGGTFAELVWAAGLFEGEGTITIARRGQDDTYRLLVLVSNTDEEIIDFFHDRWGGWKQPAYGHRPGRRPAWNWSAAGPTAEVFLRGIEPFVRCHRVREKLDIGIDLRANQSRSKAIQQMPGYREVQRELYAEMQVLNRRGVPVLFLEGR